MRRWVWMVGTAIAVGGWLVTGAGEAAEHGGKEHGGKEHGGTTAAPAPHGTADTSAPMPPAPSAPSAQAIRAFIQQHIEGQLNQGGTLTMQDHETGAARRLQFVRVHDRVGKTGGLYYSCTDMKDADTGELLDLDFDVQATGGHLAVVGTRIHKVSGKARYTYDANDNRVPIPPETR